MTDQLRKLAEAEAAKAVPPDEMPTVDGHFIDWMKFDRERFAAGFIAGRTSVTRESIAEIIYANTEQVDYCGYGLLVVDDPLELADAILALFGEVAGDE